ncbi:hypothetical protein D1641_00170 [Colidextribacter sp. OB.20]|uniref:DUF6709 family protein n=1 Tax=Colidextribacter sp. OB.20 TaxID=2304568 RepID=UPI00136DACF7|nr:DUF6709 family protein [Colidextribacter sp. OB.20]NBI08436.1 hypothetical protein [Colidextribacter sp. OB.20]
MKFKPEIPDAVLLAEALEQDFAQAQNMGKVQLGEECLFLKKFSGAAYLPYSRITRAWLRQEEVKARLCCGTANFDQFYLVMACADGQERRGQVEDKASGQRCLDHIAVRNPEVKIGYVKPAE